MNTDKDSVQAPMLTSPPTPNSAVLWAREMTKQREAAAAETSSSMTCNPGPATLTVLALVNPEGLPHGNLLLRTTQKFGYSLRLMHVNKSDPVERASPYLAKLPKAMDILRAEPCPHAVFIMVDASDARQGSHTVPRSPQSLHPSLFSLRNNVHPAVRGDRFDAFLTLPPRALLRRFQSMRRGVVWSAEALLTYGEGINRTLLDMRARIPPTDVRSHHPRRVACEGERERDDVNYMFHADAYIEAQEPEAAHTHHASTSKMHVAERCPAGRAALHRHRYLNAGGVIGYRDDLLRFFRAVLSVRAGGEGWRDRDRVCGEARGRRCAEQWAALRVLSHADWGALNVSLDYESRLFYTAEWSLPTSMAHTQCPQSDTTTASICVHSSHSGACTVCGAVQVAAPLQGASEPRRAGRRPYDWGGRAAGERNAPCAGGRRARSSAVAGEQRDPLPGVHASLRGAQGGADLVE